MESQSTRSIWWKGALKSAAYNFAAGLAVGLVAAAAIYAFVPATLLGASMSGVLGFVSSAGAFSPLPLMAFNSIISGAIGLFTGGSQAVAAAQQQHLNISNVEMIRELDGRTRALEEFIAPSASVKKIIAAGPRTQTNYRDAEEQRAAQPVAESPTIH
jgi:hypothetical protein